MKQIDPFDALIARLAILAGGPGLADASDQAVEELLGLLDQAGSDWQLAGDLLKQLAAAGSALSHPQRQEASKHALRIYFTRGVGTYDGGAAWRFLQLIGTGEVAIAILDQVRSSSSPFLLQYVEFALQAVTAILQREIGTFHDSTLLELSGLKSISAMKIVVARQYEPDEFRDEWTVPIAVDCSVINDLASRELTRRAAQV